MKKISFILICISIVFASSVFIDYSYNLKSIVLSLSVPILLLSIVVGIVDHYRKSQLTIIGIVIPMIIGVIVASFVFFKILNAVPSVGIVIGILILVLFLSTIGMLLVNNKRVLLGFVVLIVYCVSSLFAFYLYSEPQEGSTQGFQVTNNA